MKKDLNFYSHNTLTEMGFYIASELFIILLDILEVLMPKHVNPSNICWTYNEPSESKKNDLFSSVANFYQFAIKLNSSDKSSVKYYAPEFINLNICDTRSKIYSLGIILQELFSIDINRYKIYFQ